MTAIIIDQNDVLNQTILVGLTYLQANHDIDEQIQVFGRIVEIDESDPGLPTITLQASDNQTWYLPLYCPCLGLAPRGEYILNSTGEKVTDPDFLAAWTIFSVDDPEHRGNWRPNYSPIDHYDNPPHWDFTYEHDDAYIKELINKYGEKFLDKTVLVGVTYFRGAGDAEKLINREQFFGKIIQISNNGIQLLLESGEEYSLPPDIAILEPAEPCIYELKSTNEIVENPDFISTWTAHRPENQAG